MIVQLTYTPTCSSSKAIVIQVTQLAGLLQAQAGRLRFREAAQIAVPAD
jgi:hypothetical protein